MGTRGFAQVRRNLRTLEKNIKQELNLGMHRGARVLQDRMQTIARDRIAGMSGATFASTVGVAVTELDGGENVAGSALDAATALLNQFDGHDGKPFAENVSSRRSLWHIYGTTYTDYAIKLQRENAGAKAYQLDALLDSEQQIVDELLEPVRALLR